MLNRIAASLALPTTDLCLEALHALVPHIGIAEVRLDRMDSYDLPRLINAAPCPLIVTCRPQREGGAFIGTEEERLDVLLYATELGCAYVDIEWDSAASLHAQRRTSTQLIVSRHWTDHMPSDMIAIYDELCSLADAVKLVGLAEHPADLLPIFDLLQHASKPVIGIAMGDIGQVTRLLALCFSSCLLTYGAYHSSALTAPGQLTIADMVDIYHLHAIGPHTVIHLHLCSNSAAAAAVIAKNTHVVPGADLYVPLIVSPVDAPAIKAGLARCLPQLIVTADSALSQPPTSPIDVAIQRGDR